MLHLLMRFDYILISVPATRIMGTDHGTLSIRTWADANRKVLVVILPKDRDPRFVTIRRGGTLTDSNHHLLALWAAWCAEDVLDFYESARPADPRPRRAIELGRAWARGEITMTRPFRCACGRGSNQLRVKLLSVRAPPDHVNVWTAGEAVVKPVGNSVTLTEYVAPDVRRPVVAK